LSWKIKGGSQSLLIICQIPSRSKTKACWSILRITQITWSKVLSTSDWTFIWITEISIIL
jgi:hypothetical protein